MLPVYKFVEGSDAPGLYDAIGGTPTLSFRLLDVYGNALEGAQYSQQFQVLYSDPLITPAEWPGIRIAYRIGRDEKEENKPSLIIDIQFTPKELFRSKTLPFIQREDEQRDDADTFKSIAQTALQKYTIIVNQLRDKNTTVNLETSLFSKRAPVGDQRLFQKKLYTIASTIEKELEQVAKDGSISAVTAQAWHLPLHIDPSDMSKRKDSIFPISVWLQLSRPENLIDATAKKHYKDALSKELIVQPNIDYTAETSALASPVMVTNDSSANFERFARDFEKVFSHFWGGWRQLSKLR